MGSEVKADVADIIDSTALRNWLDAQGVGTGPVGEMALLAGGTQNILLRFERDGHSYVLRRPSLTPRKGADGLMLREARLLGAIAGSAVPHPRLIAACGDSEIIGAAFYVMEAVDGFNATTGLPESHHDAAAQYAMGLALADGIAALGAIDHAAAGLADFGRPDGFLERQVTRWASEMDGYDHVASWPGRSSLPDIEPLKQWLDRHRPAQFTPGIMHGDYHVGNVMFRPDRPDLAAIIDWELATIGDPILDLAWLIATWPDEAGRAVSPTLDVQPWIGFPTASELVERYRAGSSRDLSAIDWYVALACYKLGTILEGTHVRAWAGEADMTTGKMFHQVAINLFDRANGLIR